jgi:hypothetical protein
MFQTVCFFLLVFLFADNQLAYSAEVKKWAAQGEAVSVAQSHQLRAAATNVEPMGAILIWEDFRDANRVKDIYGQRIDVNGQVVWQVDGIPLIMANKESGEPAWHADPAIVADGMSGAIFTWTDSRDLKYDVYAQRIGSNGELKWQENGMPISTACWTVGGVCGNDKHYPQIISDGNGGAIITWYEIRDGYHLSVWAQRVNADGAVLWETDGIPIVVGEFHADFPKIVSNDNGGAIIVWQDGRDVSNDGTYRIYAQYIDANGVAQWAANGVSISPGIALRGLQGHSVIPDGFGGAVISWVDGRKNDSNDADIYVQKINSNGHIQWLGNGVPVCTRERHQYSPKMSTDKAGGAIIVWEDQGASPPGSGQQWLYAQRISGSGNIQWALDGMPIYTDHSHNPRVISDNGGGAIIVWDYMDISDPFIHIPNLLAQHVTGRGQLLWQTEGFVIYFQIGGNYGFGPKIINSGHDGAIVHWTDYRNQDTAWDIYAQKIAFNAAYGKAMPWIPLLLMED